MTTKAIEWLQKYNGTFQFYLSLKHYAAGTGFLTPNQEAAVLRAIEKEKSQNELFSLQAGHKLELVKSVCERIRNERGFEIMFRNVEVVDVRGETPRAILVSLKLISTISRVCHVCGMGLDNDISRATGIGPVCAKKLGFSRPKMSNAQEILAKLESYANSVGVIQDVWLPKWSYSKSADVTVQVA